MQFNVVVESFLDRFGSWENYKQYLLKKYNYDLTDIRNLYRTYKSRAALNYDELKVLKAFHPELFKGQ